jgi:hypothetical protein
LSIEMPGESQCIIAGARRPAVHPMDPGFR